MSLRFVNWYIEAHTTMDEQRDLSVQEEYELWRKNCPVMYEFVSETALTWPSLTVQWLPEPIDTVERGIPQKLLIGTHTSGEAVDYLKVASCVLPSSLIHSTPVQKSPDHKSTEEEEEPQVNEQQTTQQARLRVVKKFEHQMEVNRARYNPLNPSQVSTISGAGRVFIYDVNADKTQSPLELKHHTENGYGLSWNPFVNGQLLTSSDDSTVALWDVNSSEKPLMNVFKDHSDIVNEVQWHNFEQNVFGSVSDDKTVKLFDTRDSKCTQTLDREGAINTIAFSKHSANLFAIGLEDSTIELLDIRNPGHKLHTIMGHSESISCLEWDPHNDGILASGSQDRRVILWDIKRIGEEQTQEDEDDGAPELFMMHAGHTAGVTDLSFNAKIPFTLASCADDNIIHLWKIARKLTNEYTGADSEEVDVYSLE